MALLIAVCAAIAVTAVIVGPGAFGPTIRVRRVKVSLTDRLEHAQVPVTAARWRIVVAVTATTIGLLVWAATGAFGPAVIPAVLAGLLPGSWLRRAERRQIAERTDAWPEALRDLVGHLRTTSSVRAGLVALGETGPIPLRDSWRRFAANSTSIGAPAAFTVIQSELADPISDRVIAVVREVEQRGGGDVAFSVLNHLIVTVTDDIRLTKEIAARQYETQIQGVVCAILPFALLLVLVSMSTEFRTFYRTAAGTIVIAVGAVMGYGGWMWIARLGRQRIEPRFLSDPSQGARP